MCLFAVYLDELPILLGSGRLGCTVGNMIVILVNQIMFADDVIRGSMGGLRGMKPPLNFFRYVFCSVVPGTETPIGALFCIAFK